jgi:hypothetical protein
MLNRSTETKMRTRPARLCAVRHHVRIRDQQPPHRVRHASKEQKMRTTLMGLGVLAASLAAVLAGGSPAQAEIPGHPICAPLLGQTCSGNVALNALVVGSGVPCALGSGPQNAVDGASSNIYTDKWCVLSGQPRLTIQLPVYFNGFTVSNIVIRHAGAAGESSAYNTRAYRVSTKSEPYCVADPLVTVTNNTSSQTFHNVGRANVSQVVLDVIAPTQGTGGATRIYEVEVWGKTSDHPKPPCAFG